MAVKNLDGKEVDFISLIDDKNCVVIVYPKMGESGNYLPSELRELKGLTGCSNQCRAYGQNLEIFNTLGFEVIALSAQSVQNAREFRDSLGVKFDFYSDENFELEKALGLQSFTTNDGKKFYHRQSLIIKNGKILKRFNRIQNPQNDALNIINEIKNLKS